MDNRWRKSSLSKWNCLERENFVEWTAILDVWMIAKALDSVPSYRVFTVPKSIYESADIAMLEDVDNEEEEDD
jgi:hypothetical protein